MKIQTSQLSVAHLSRAQCAEYTATDVNVPETLALTMGESSAIVCSAAAPGEAFQFIVGLASQIGGAATVDDLRKIVLLEASGKNSLVALVAVQSETEPDEDEAEELIVLSYRSSRQGARMFLLNSVEHFELQPPRKGSSSIGVNRLGLSSSQSVKVHRGRRESTLLIAHGGELGHLISVLAKKRDCSSPRMLIDSLLDSSEEDDVCTSMASAVLGQSQDNAAPVDVELKEAIMGYLGKQRSNLFCHGAFLTLY